MTEDLLTVTALCKAFGVTRVTIWNWRCRGFDSLPCISIPGDKRSAIRFKREDVIAWAKRNEKELTL